MSHEVAFANADHAVDLEEEGADASALPPVALELCLGAVQYLGDVRDREEGVVMGVPERCDKIRLMVGDRYQVGRRPGASAERILGRLT
jgi:hypothetical protein